MNFDDIQYSIEIIKILSAKVFIHDKDSDW